MAWGFDTHGNITVPTAAQSGVTAVAAGYGLSLALKTNGTVVAWGNNTANQTGFAGTLTGVVAIAAQNTHVVALRENGTVVAWGNNTSFGQTNVPAGLANVIAVSAGGQHSLALKADGTVVTWGNTFGGRLIVPADLSGVTAIAAGSLHSMALKSDGTVVVGGLGSSGQTNVPAGLSGVVAIAAKGDYCLALKDDVVVVGWGDNDFGQLNFPAGLTGVTAIAAGDFQALALFTNYQTEFSIMVAEDSGAYAQPGFLTNISAGPPDEAGQVVSFLVSAEATNLFAVPPAISPNGTLTFIPATNANGTATVTVRAQDDGGTANGGADTSAPQTFILTVNPVNDAPRVTFATNSVVVAQDGGAANIANFAVLSPGPAGESGQTATLVSVANDNPSLFTAGGQPALSAAGELAFQPGPGPAGTATVTVVVQDDGGTANGGQDRTTNTFTILVAATRVFVGAVPDSVPNGTLTVPVNLAGVGAESGAAFTFSFDPAVFIFGGVNLGGGAGGASLLTNSSQIGS